MKNILVVSYSGFSDTDANGKTLKALLSGFKPENLMQFYCGNQQLDFSCCNNYFHVTDMQMLKMLLGKRESHYFSLKSKIEDSTKCNNIKIQKSNRFTKFLKKNNYNFGFRTLREYLWDLGMWGKKEFFNAIEDFSPDMIFYMVGESFFMDRLVMDLMKKFSIPVVLYNAEAYRLVKPKERNGLERFYYHKVKKSYSKLNEKASLVVYNSNYLKNTYLKQYKNKNNSIVVFNSDVMCTKIYNNYGEVKNISYFGNLGVGRVESLITVAKVISNINKSLVLDVYGRTTEENILKFSKCNNIKYHGFVDQNKLQEVKNNSDILIHVESFDKLIVPKLKYAFSTKIAQYLCAGRCMVSFAPYDMASTQYLVETNAAIVSHDEQDLEQKMRKVISDSQYRKQMADQALKIATNNHDKIRTSKLICDSFNKIIRENIR